MRPIFLQWGECRIWNGNKSAGRSSSGRSHAVAECYENWHSMKSCKKILPDKYA